MSEEKEIFKNLKEYMQNSIDKGYHKFVYNDFGWDFKCIDCINAIDNVLNLIEKQQAEIEQLKYSITKATKIIDEYANETEKDTKKLIEYQENFLQELLDEEK